MVHRRGAEDAELGDFFTEGLRSLRKPSGSLSGASDYYSRARRSEKDFSLGRNDKPPLASFAPLRELLDFFDGLLCALCVLCGKFRIRILSHYVTLVPSFVLNCLLRLRLCRARFFAVS